ncbi:MAG: hypothetical protein QXN55_07310 [Candidatus Nitrosotenuis sp.]
MAGATGTQVNQDKFVKAGVAPFAGRSDGVYCDKSTYGCAGFSNAQLEVPLSRSMYINVFEDFLGATVIPLNGALDLAEGPWTLKDNSSAGAPTTAIVADADNGQYAIILASNDEAEVETLYWNDELNIDTAGGPVMVLYMTVNEDITTNDTLVFGFADAQNDTTDSTTYNAWFKLAETMDLLIESDNNTTNDDDNDTGINLVEDTWYMFKIDCSDPTDCDFFYSTTPGNDWTELLASTPFAIGSGVNVQSYIQIQKSGSGTDSTVPGITIDYVNVYWKRKAL